MGSKTKCAKTSVVGEVCENCMVMMAGGAFVHIYFVLVSVIKVGFLSGPCRRHPEMGLILRSLVGCFIRVT